MREIRERRQHIQIGQLGKVVRGQNERHEIRYRFRERRLDTANPVAREEQRSQPWRQREVP